MLEQKLSYSQNAAKRVSTYLAVQTYEGDKNGTRLFFFFFLCMSDSSGIVLAAIVGGWHLESRVFVLNKVVCLQRPYLPYSSQ